MSFNFVDTKPNLICPTALAPAWQPVSKAGSYEQVANGALEVGSCLIVELLQAQMLWKTPLTVCADIL